MTWRDVLHESRLRAHNAWVRRGRVGDGRLELSDENLSDARSNTDDFSYAQFERCTFDNATIEFAHFENAILVLCSVRNATMIRGRFNDATIRSCRFDGSDLRRNWFLGSSINDCVFDRATLRESNFVEATINRSSFCDADLDIVQLDNARFHACDLRRARLGETAYGTQFIDCDFRGANLQGLKLRDTHFIRCRFAGVTGTPIIEGAVELTDADLSSEEAFEGPSSTDELRRTWGL